MHVPAAGETAVQLPWLWPDAQSLLALGQPLTPATWPTLRRDPGALLFVLRQRTVPDLLSAIPAIEPTRFLEPSILETALHWLQDDQGSWLDWRQPSLLPIYECALAIAHYARLLAQQAHCCDPAAAWTAGLLAPLGWFAIATCDPDLVSRCRSDPDFPNNPFEVQRRLWGLDHALIARRLARRWLLPDWLRVVIGHLDLSIQTAEPLGVDPSLFAVLQLAVLMADQAGYSLGLAPAAEEENALAWLRLGANDLELVRDRFQAVDLSEPFESEWCDPRTVVDLAVPLQEAMERRRAEVVPFLGLLERDFGRLQKIMMHDRSGRDDRLRDAKLEALAEFAAGASHEINNPLAVIAGQSQYLLNRDHDERHRSALESIVRQTQRIHGILAELMQFARPPRIIPMRLSLAETVKKSVHQYLAHAGEAGVELKCDLADLPTWIDGDARQLQTAISCLIRNAIEAAAPGKGWVRIGLERINGVAEVCVEDSGPGLTPEQREHMFDPFYSGRSAGRGRGLGLPTAWRLARQHGGDVRHQADSGGPTQFVLILPLSDQLKRLSA